MSAVKTKQEPLETYLIEIEKAKRYKDLLDKGADPEKWFKRYARVCHPDIVPPHYKRRAEEAFKRLGQLYGEFTGKSTPPPQTVIAGCVVTSSFMKGDICDLYLAESENDPRSIIKIARSPKDNDLMDREKAALNCLWNQKVMDNFKKYLPQMHAATKASGRRVNIIHEEAGYHSLQDIANMMSGTIDYRHIVWMVNRVLSVLGFIHRSGVVHGAVLANHMLFQPEEHGLKLVDWCYSSLAGQHTPAIVRDYSSLYPPEVLKKRPAGPWTDIYMLMKTINRVTGNVPKRFRDLIQWCVAESPSARPDDAWKIQDMWIGLAKEEYGKPKYIKLELPSN